MKNWNYYKDKVPVNMDKVSKITKSHRCIFFIDSDGTTITDWKFDSYDEWNLVYEAIKSYMTEIKLNYHPDLDEY